MIYGVLRVALGGGNITAWLMLLQYDDKFYAFKEKPKPLNLKQGVDFNLGKRWQIKWQTK